MGFPRCLGPELGLELYGFGVQGSRFGVIATTSYNKLDDGDDGGNRIMTTMPIVMIRW